jgi:hypothetical protein
MPRRVLLLVTLALLASSAGLAGTEAPQRAKPAVTPPAAPIQTADAGRAATSQAGLSPRNANYSIDVRLDHASHTLTAREVITWRNISAGPASDLRLHLYYNAWKNTRSTWMREIRVAGRGADEPPDAGDWGWIDVTAVRLITGESTPLDLTARRRYIAPDDGNRDDQTVLQVPLPAPVQPGETVNIEVSWTSKIPRTFARTGVIGSFYFIGQWFPKLGVLEDTGWNCHQFHAGTEFYSDFGVYDVRLTVPRGWVLGASGRERARRDNADATTTVTYHAEDVHDFAWTVSPDYIERRARFEHPTLPPVEMRLLLQPEHAAQADRHFDATRTALRYYGEWFGAYPYGNITIIDPAWQSGAGGMEYPTLFTAGSRWIAPAGVTQPEGVTVHEAGHQFWYGIVGNNEFEHAWLDEGFNTFSTARAVDANPAYRVNYYSRRYFGGFVPYVFRDIPLSREVNGDGLSGDRYAAKSDAQSTLTYEYFPATGGGLSYSKTALWLHTLERYLGWPTFQRVMSTHFERWKFRHPRPQDFFAVVNEVAGRDMTWFFDQVYRSSNVFDYGVESVASEPARGAGYVDRNGKMELDTRSEPGPIRSTVVVRRYGEALFPVDVLVVFRNGEKVRERWHGRERWTAFVYERPVGVAYAVVDPDRVLLLDINRTNNSFTTTPMAAPAARKWTLKWLVWLQDALMNCGFFV